MLAVGWRFARTPEDPRGTSEGEVQNPRRAGCCLMSKSRRISLNVARPPALTRVRSNREAYLVCVRVIGSRRHFHVHRSRKFVSRHTGRRTDRCYSPSVSRLPRERSCWQNCRHPHAVRRAYAITETAVRILRVLHCAQEWPDTMQTRWVLFSILSINGSVVRSFSRRRIRLREILQHGQKRMPIALSLGQANAAFDIGEMVIH